MEMQGNRQLPVTQQQAWDALNDPAVLKICIPGCDKVEPTGENQYAIGMAVKIGPVSAKFAGKITLSEIVPPDSYTITFEGQGGAAGFGKGNAKVKLVPNDAGCELQYAVQAQVGGKVAQLGQRLIDGAAKSMAEDFFKRFDDEMRRRFPAPEVVPVEVAPGAAVGIPVGAASGADIPVPPAANAPAGKPNIPTWAWVVAAALIALAAYWVR